MFILGGQCVEFASTMPLQDKTSSALFYCSALPNISGNADVSGQKACLFPTMYASKRLPNGNVKKQLQEKN